MIWLSIPVGTIVGWIYVVMELIGGYSEFTGRYTNAFYQPMLSISRAIEIDLLQMIREKDIPAPIQPKKNVLW